MGTKLKDLVEKQEISMKELEGKTLSIDSFNYLYQFLTTIRQRDGTPLLDSKGRVTSHINGLFFRTMKLLEHNIKLIFVFDGEPPAIKKLEIERRKELKADAKIKLTEAKEKGDIETIRKMSSRVTYLTKEMIKESQTLIQLMGQPVVNAPSEGEAQASDLVKRGLAHACISQDFDTLLFGCPLLIRNLSVEGKRRKSNTSSYYSIKPEQISLTETINKLGIDQEQLIVLSMLIGTDFCPKGIPGIGPKKALKLVKQYKKDFNELFTSVNWESHHIVTWREVFYTIKKMPVKENLNLVWTDPDIDKIEKFLSERNFSMDRVKSRLQIFKPKPQRELSTWFK